MKPFSKSPAGRDFSRSAGAAVSGQAHALPEARGYKRHSSLIRGHI